MKKKFLLWLAAMGCYAAIAQPALPDRNKVMDYLQNQQFEELINYLAPAVAGDSSNLQWLGWIGYASYMNDNIAAAKKYYAQMWRIDSNNLAANQYLAILQANSNPPAALRFTAALLQLQPGKALHYRNMADLFRKINQKDSALFYYSCAYQLSPNDNKIAAGYSETLIDKKMYSAADSIIEKGLAMDSLNIPLLKLRIRSAYETKNYPLLLLPGERLVRLGEVATGSLTKLAIAYYNLKGYAGCIRVCEWLQSNEVDDESVYYYEARAQARLNHFNESNELLQRCLDKAISKTAELYYYTLGENGEAMQKFGLAVKQYDTAYYLFKNPLMKYYAARLYETSLKNEPLARKYFRQYLLLAQPGSAEEKKVYDYIKARYGRKH